MTLKAEMSLKKFEIDIKTGKNVNSGWSKNGISRLG